ncbi:MAG: polyribonucleotide nucleotidyltransferase [Deltaproteobacteria bacterium]|nr:polyribonucleotide nucleotidyltransferase [Deltaproteobacteria bacterium]
MTSDELKIDVRGYCRQASGSCFLQKGGTVVLATAVRSDVSRSLGFLPLTVDYLEKSYAAGKIPGGFFRREGRLTERETLVSRIIDRSLRPIFPKEYDYDTQITVTVLSIDEASDPDVLAVNASSLALVQSDIPFEGPVGCVRICKINGNLVVNPPLTDQRKATLNFIVSGTQNSLCMVEGEALEEPEEVVIMALQKAQKEIIKMCEIQKNYVSAKDKIYLEKKSFPETFVNDAYSYILDDITEALQTSEKLERKNKIKVAQEKLVNYFLQTSLAEEFTINDVEVLYHEFLKKLARDTILHQKKRIDGRSLDDIRPLEFQIGLLPRTHGSAMFRRGETQAIVVTTLGTFAEAQKLDYAFGDEVKTFMLHYNFPGFAVGEVRPFRAPSRREIGHGFLAERALKAVLPTTDDFPYVIRVVSEIIESNGSSSMATVCGGSLSLMDAGVPINKHVAGIAMGLIMEGKEYSILTDILGDEDHLGDMDFKVCGTRDGITALQMDIKLSQGLDADVLQQALEKAKRARNIILDKMEETIKAPREKISEYAPQFRLLKIKPEKIKDLIGPGGKTIKSIIDTFQVKIDVEQDGEITVYGTQNSKLDQAVSFIEGLVGEIEIGSIMEGVVTKITPFGLIVSLVNSPNQGLVHISQLPSNIAGSFSRVFKEGDTVKVKVLEVDERGRLRLGMKDI